MWLATIVTDHCRDKYVTFWNIWQGRLVADWILSIGDLWGGECLKPVFVEKRACVNTLTLLYIGDDLVVTTLMLAGLFLPLIWVYEGQGMLTLLGGTSRNFGRRLRSRSCTLQHWRNSWSSFTLLVCSRCWPCCDSRLGLSRGTLRRSVSNWCRPFISVSSSSSIFTSGRCSG